MFDDVTKNHQLEPIAQSLITMPAATKKTSSRRNNTTNGLRNVRRIRSYEGDDGTPPEIFSELTCHDVLVGRGGTVAMLPGNIHYRCVIWDHRDIYSRAEDKDKAGIAAKLLQKLSSLDPPGRIVERRVPDGGYATIPLPRAVEKVCQSLRERNNTEPKHYREYLRLHNPEKLLTLQPAKSEEAKPRVPAAKKIPMSSSRKKQPHQRGGRHLNEPAMSLETLAAVKGGTRQEAKHPKPSRRKSPHTKIKRRPKTENEDCILESGSGADSKASDVQEKDLEGKQQEHAPDGTADKIQAASRLLGLAAIKCPRKRSFPSAQNCNSAFSQTTSASSPPSSLYAAPPVKKRVASLLSDDDEEDELAQGELATVEMFRGTPEQRNGTGTDEESSANNSAAFEEFDNMFAPLPQSWTAFTNDWGENVLPPPFSKEEQQQQARTKQKFESNRQDSVSPDTVMAMDSTFHHHHEDKQPYHSHAAAMEYAWHQHNYSAVPIQPQTHLQRQHSIMGTTVETPCFYSMHAFAGTELHQFHEDVRDEESAYYVDEPLSSKIVFEEGNPNYGRDEGSGENSAASSYERGM